MPEYDWLRGGRGALGGVMTGAGIGSIFPGPGTAIGAGAGGLLGLLAGTGKSPESVRAERYRKFVDWVLGQKKEALATGIEKSTALTKGLVQQAGARGERLARSLGRAEDVEAYRLPGAGQAANIGSQTQQELIENINRQYGDILTQAEWEYAQRPMEPDIADLLETLAGPAMKYKQGRDYLGLLAGRQGGAQYSPEEATRLWRMFNENLTGASMPYWSGGGW